MTMLTFMNSLLSQKYSENSVRSWTDVQNLSKCIQPPFMHALSRWTRRRFRSETTSNQSDLHTLLSFLIIMILFNVYLTKVYHVRNILTFVNFWTEATNLPTFVWNPVNSSCHAEHAWPRQSYFWHENRWDIRRWKFSVRIKCRSVMIFGQKISAPVLSRFINNLSCSNACKNLTHTRCFYRFAIDIITWKNDISVSFRIIV